MDSIIRASTDRCYSNMLRSDRAAYVRYELGRRSGIRPEELIEKRYFHSITRSAVIRCSEVN